VGRGGTGEEGSVMTDDDQLFADRLRAKYGRPKPATGAPDGRKPDATWGRAPDRQAAADAAAKQADQEFFDKLMQQSDRKWRDRQQRRDKDDRRQEGQDRWNR
jgi:hypothetical protein